MAAKDGTVLAASGSGKFKAIMQAVATILIIGVFYLQYFEVKFPYTVLSFPISYYIIAVPTILSVLSGIEYYKRNWGVILKGLK
jgi:CDP-diacylglycerol--glycerol-3-phosphate 3-phosphatidyltransferase